MAGNPSTRSSTNAIGNNEAGRTQVPADQEEEYSPLDDLFLPEKIVQMAIVGITIHLAYEKYYHSSGLNRLYFQCGAIVLIGILVGAYSKYKASGRNAALLPKFEIIYMVYLPFMLSFLFDRSTTIVNCALMLNSIEISLPFRLPMQFLFISYNTMELSLEDKYPFLMAVVINYIIFKILAKISHLKSLDTIDCNLFSMLLTNVLYLHESSSIHFQVLKGTLLALILTIGANFLVSIPLRPLSNSFSRSAILGTIFAVGFPLTVKRLLPIENEDPLNWLVNYIAISQTRKSILVVWLTSLFILIPNVLIFKSNFTLNTSRKVWHFLILLLITQPFRMDPDFVKLSLAGTIVLFLSVEYLRYLKLEPFGGYIDSQLRLFSDFRDEKGPIIISYIYLIIGIATPLLINNSPVGLISLGVGDSLASIIGGKWGRTFWPGTTKTIEGTMAFILSTSAAAFVFKQYLGYFTNISEWNLCIVCAFSGLLEGNSVMNDNILIPAFMMISEQLLAY